MKVGLITTANKFKSEIDLVVQLFNAGLDVLYLKKPKFSKNKLEEYIKAIPSEYHQRIVTYSHFSLASKYGLKGIHLSRKTGKISWKTRLELRFIRLFNSKLQVSTTFHSVHSLLESTYRFDYVLLSPVFNDATPNGFGVNYNRKQLEKTLQETNYKVYAVGGINMTTAGIARTLGFNGVVLFGGLWKSDISRVEFLHQIKNASDPNILPKLDIKPMQINLHRPDDHEV